MVNSCSDQGTITWEDFVIGARHILQVSDSICDGWSLCGTLVSFKAL